MTHITTEAAIPAEAPLHPSDMLMSLIIALLAPMFLGVSSGDVGLARLAAIETVSAYRTRNYADLIAVAQIVAFGLAALGSLSLSLADDIPLAMALRLRGNANALNRSAEQNRRALAQNYGNDPTLHPTAEAYAAASLSSEADTMAEFDAFLSVAAAQELAAEADARLQPPEHTDVGAPTTAAPSVAAPSAAVPSVAVPDKRFQEMWAIAMVKEAAEITASIPHLPLAERHPASIRAATLSSTANHLLYGTSNKRRD
jgi:hypothetical protein